MDFFYKSMACLRFEMIFKRGVQPFFLFKSYNKTWVFTRPKLRRSQNTIQGYRFHSLSINRHSTFHFHLFLKWVNPIKRFFPYFCSVSVYSASFQVFLFPNNYLDGIEITVSFRSLNSITLISYSIRQRFSVYSTFLLKPNQRIEGYVGRKKGAFHFPKKCYITKKVPR